MHHRAATGIEVVVRRRHEDVWSRRGFVRQGRGAAFDAEEAPAYRSTVCRYRAMFRSDSLFPCERAVLGSIGCSTAPFLRGVGRKVNGSSPMLESTATPSSRRGTRGACFRTGDRRLDTRRPGLLLPDLG
jgi:hypothetical protein